MLHRLLDPVMRRLPIQRIVEETPYLWALPHLGIGERLRYRPHYGSWPTAKVAVPPDLQSIAGIRRHPDEEQQAYERAPIGNWNLAHSETIDVIFRRGWAHHLPMAPARQRSKRSAKRLLARVPAPRREEDPARLTRELKARAAALGMSACGVARYDEKYTFVESRDHQVGDRIVLGVLESNWAATQTAPSVRSEKAQIAANHTLTERLNELGSFLVDRGYRVRVGDDHVILHYAVEAGLGQLGMNGQVLTPQAGSRCRIRGLNTDAPLLLDAPVDLGVEKICDACQLCVRRCPSGAIPNKRAYHRGIEKAKINPSRCAPTCAKQHQCAVCMKVCPVQRYGLTPVMAEFEASGRILGKGTDELESYRFEGKLYQVGERPKLRPEWFQEIPWRDSQQ